MHPCLFCVQLCMCRHCVSFCGFKQDEAQNFYFLYYVNACVIQGCSHTYTSITMLMCITICPSKYLCMHGSPMLVFLQHCSALHLLVHTHVCYDTSFETCKNSDRQVQALLSPLWVSLHEYCLRMLQVVSVLSQQCHVFACLCQAMCMKVVFPNIMVTHWSTAMSLRVYAKLHALWKLCSKYPDAAMSTLLCLLRVNAKLHSSGLYFKPLHHGYVLKAYTKLSALMKYSQAQLKRARIAWHICFIIPHHKSSSY